MPEGDVRGDVEHGEGGKFQDKYGDDEVLEALAEAYPEPLTNQEVADRVGCSKATAHNRLHELKEEGVVYTKMPGARARVWWVDMTDPAPKENGSAIRGVLEGDRQLTIGVASRFQPGFNPTRTGTDKMIEFILKQPWGEVNRALEEAITGETDGDS